VKLTPLEIAMIRQRIETHYVDEQGLVSPYWMIRPGGKHQASLNGVAYTSLYYILLWMHDAITEEDKLNYSVVIYACMKEPGLLRRSPSDDNMQAHDDLVYFAVACLLLGLFAPSLMVREYMKRHYGVYNTEVPGTWRDKTGRFRPGVFIIRHGYLWAVLSWGAGVKAPLWSRLWLALKIRTDFYHFPGFKNIFRPKAWRIPYGDTSGIVLTFVMMLAAKVSGGRLEAWAIKHWWKDLHWLYGQAGIQKVFEIYFNDVESEQPHPFIEMVK
jgi:hypothetical protein